MLNLSRVYLDRGNPEEALEWLDAALEIDTESGVAYRLKGRALRQLGETEEAIGAYRQAIFIDDRDAWSMNNLGLIFIEEEHFDMALPPLARAVQLRSENALFQNNLGMALERTGQMRTAESAYRAAVNADESHTAAFANLKRIEAVAEDPELPPVTLDELAGSFCEEIYSWRHALDDEAGSDSLEMETHPVVVREAETSIDCSSLDPLRLEAGTGPGE
jgi:Flp pilus assembly protein TadD